MTPAQEPAEEPARLQVLLDPRWIELPIDTQVDAGSWAAEAVADALAVRGIVEPAPVVHLYVQTYAAILDSIRERAAAIEDVRLVGAFALVGQDELLADTVAELAYVPVDSDRFDDVVDSFVVPAEQRFAEPDVSELDTDFGTAVRLQQLRIVPPDDSADPSVQASVIYLWPAQVPGRAVVLSAWFGSPVDADTTRPVVDQLAASLRVEPT